MSVPALRFKDESGQDFPEWEEVELKDIAERVKTKNKEDNKNVLTISAQQGLINQEEYFNKFWNENTENLIKPLFERFALAEPFDHDTLDVITKTYLAETNTKFGPLMNPVRLIITGKSVGASILDTMAILGKDKCMQRFNEFMTKYSGKYTL